LVCEAALSLFKKNMKYYFLFLLFLCGVLTARSQTIDVSNSLLRSFKPDFSINIRHIDIDHDGDPDLIMTSIFDSIPAIWIDDDDDMKWTDLEGDLDSDCLIIDRNRDGIFAGPGDLSVDFVDTNGDGIAEMAVVVENSNKQITNRWDWESNYMWIIDSEQDGTFHYINWKEMVLKCWSHYGAANFYEDYHGQTLFLKAHLPSYRFSDLRYSWENPFLFYDPDGDGLTEMTIRLEDGCRFAEDKSPDKTAVDTYPTGKIDRAFLSFDLDNDNGPSNEFDFDMTLYFSGEGFSYNDQIYKFKNMRGLPAADSLFYDKRWRTMDELIYTDHDSAWSHVFERGVWNQCWFTFDEDDDCERWERVETYEPKNPFKIGMNKEGIDNNPQSDAAGDRGEWDMDNSGKGNLYIGFDGRIHLFGAEKGYWRIDQDAWSYQGWGGLYEDGFQRTQKEPAKFATIAYEDTNNDGFFNLVKYDLDGDTIFEQSFDFSNYQIKADYSVFETSKADFHSLSSLFEKSANGIWEQAESAIKAAEKFNINYKWYSQLLHPKSMEEKYRNGYWLQFYLFTDFIELAKRKNDNALKEEIIRAYFSQNWEILNQSIGN
jgi:hypothetical protein